MRLAKATVDEPFEGYVKHVEVKPLHIGPARGHIANSIALKNRGIGLKISALAYILIFQSNPLKKLPHFLVKNIFLAQKMKKWQGFKIRKENFSNVD